MTTGGETETGRTNPPTASEFDIEPCHLLPSLVLSKNSFHKQGPWHGLWFLRPNKEASFPFRLRSIPPHCRLPWDPSHPAGWLLRAVTQRACPLPQALACLATQDH